MSTMLQYSSRFVRKLKRKCKKQCIKGTSYIGQGPHSKSPPRSPDPYGECYSCKRAGRGKKLGFWHITRQLFKTLDKNVSVKNISGSRVCLLYIVTDTNTRRQFGPKVPYQFKIIIDSRVSIFDTCGPIVHNSLTYQMFKLLTCQFLTFLQSINSQHHHSHASIVETPYASIVESRVSIIIDESLVYQYS